MIIVNFYEKIRTTNGFDPLGEWSTPKLIETKTFRWSWLARFLYWGYGGTRCTLYAEIERYCDFLNVPQATEKKS